MCAKTILVTGGHGFIGSNFIQYVLNKYPNYQIVNIDYHTEATRLDTGLGTSARYSFHRVDIRNAYAINHLFELYDITDIVHFAAETRSVDHVGEIRLYEQTNVLGTLNVLQAVQNAWMQADHQPKARYAHSQFHHISLEATHETSLYIDSKQRADAIIREFHELTGLKVVTTACPEVFGPMQKQTARMPVFMEQALTGELDRDSTGTVQNWLFVRDVCEAIDTAFHLGKAGKRYEAGWNARVSDKELANYLSFMTTHYFPGNTNPTATPATLQQGAGEPISKLPGFAPKTPFEEGLQITFDWYIAKHNAKAWLETDRRQSNR